MKKKILLGLITMVLILIPSSLVFADPDLVTLTTTESYLEGISGSSSGVGLHWQDVHAATPGIVSDNLVSTVHYDYYEFDNLSGSGAINSVWIVIQVKSIDVPDQASACAVVYTAGDYEKSALWTVSNEAYVSKVWIMNDNPVTLAPWTWAQVQNLRAGVGLRSSLSGSESMTLCRRVAVKVNYSPLLAPTDFTLTESGENVNITWTMGAGANTTLIMRQTGYYPIDTADGVQVFRNVGTSYLDNSVNLEDTEYYYRAWSCNDGGGISEDYAEGLIGGHGMLTIGIIILVLGLTALAFIMKSGMLYIVCIPAWLIFTFYMFNQTWPGENTFLPEAIAIFGVVMTIVLLATTVMHYLGNRSSEEPTYDEEKAANLKKIYNLTRKKEDKW